MANDRFPHHRLDVFGLAMDLARRGARIAKRVPRGLSRFVEQLRNSSGAIALLIAEGVNRASRAQQRRRFIEARGEAGEAAATVEVLESLELISPDESAEFQDRAARIAAMLTGLIKRNS